jgi:Lantibiotic dehydratase, N terminus
MLTPSGFFVLRSPLLPFDALQAWSSAATDRAELPQRLWPAWREPAVREAVFLASPELDAALARVSTAVDTGANKDAAHRALRSFVAYFERMCARATPFGLFAGCSVGTFGRSSQLTLPQRRSTSATRVWTYAVEQLERTPLTVSISALASSYAHMHLKRMLRSARTDFRNWQSTSCSTAYTGLNHRETCESAHSSQPASWR